MSNIKINLNSDETCLILDALDKYQFEISSVLLRLREWGNEYAETYQKLDRCVALYWYIRNQYDK